MRAWTRLTSASCVPTGALLASEVAPSTGEPPPAWAKYAFNSAGGLGAGSYFQDPVRTGRWIHVVLVINSRNRSAQYPMGYTRIYKNGVLRDTDSLADYDIVPKSGTAPLRIGTGYLGSFFQGAIGDVAFYDRELAPVRVKAHNAARRSG